VLLHIQLARTVKLIDATSKRIDSTGAGLGTAV
jgi:hypothetical protein